MSTTYVYGVNPGVDYVCLDEFGNSWLSAPLIWDHVAKRYLDAQSFMFNTDKLWGLANDPKVSLLERTLLTMTFDNGLIHAADYERAGQDIREMMRRHNIGGHWVDIADLLLSKPEYEAVGFQWTSVGENPFQGGWSDDDEELPTDWRKFWDIYDEVRSYERA